MSSQQEEIQAVHDHIEQHFDQHLENTRNFLRQRSVSATGEGIPETAALLADWTRKLGAQAQVIETPGFPVVHAEIDNGAEKTMMIYGMYDTMPVEGEVWRCDPFAADILEVEGVGPSIVARGAVNSKGPLASALSMLESWKAVHGGYPVNLKFIFEGEEELGSPSMPAVVEAHKDRLHADGGIFPAHTQQKDGKPVIHLGFKGILFIELYARGGDWGGPVAREVHSSRAVWYHSPTILLAQALASIISPDQKRILIDGFYDAVADVPPEDEPLLEALAQTFDPSANLEEDQVRRFKFDLQGIDLLKKYLYEPSYNIAGYRSGDTGPGAKTILPHDAFAKIGFRLVPNQDAQTIFKQLEAHFEKHGFSMIDVHLHDTTKWARTSVNEPVVQAALKATRDFGFEPEVWPTMAGSSPMFLFTETLKTPMVPVGLGHGAGAHGPNEYASVEGLKLCEQSLASTMRYFAD